jgi:hypothetical protein
MCWRPLGAGTAALWHTGDALEVVVGGGEVAAVVVAGPLVEELELLPHPAIVSTRTRIGSALRTALEKHNPIEASAPIGLRAIPRYGEMVLPKLCIDSPPPRPAEPMLLAVPPLLSLPLALPAGPGRPGGMSNVWVFTPAGVVSSADLTP